MKAQYIVAWLRHHNLAFVTAVNELQSSAIPLLASPQGGVAASSIRYCEATEAAAAGVVFLLVFDRKTTPASRSAEASRYFVTRSATPPCGDARRGICSIPICSQLHRPSLQWPCSTFCAKPVPTN